MLKRIDFPVQYFWIGGMTVWLAALVLGWHYISSWMVENWSQISVGRVCSNGGFLDGNKGAG
jgi:hypothetical protein